MTQLRAVISESLRNAGRYNTDYDIPPAAVFWPDQSGAWASVVPLIRQGVPVLTLGDFTPEQATGPAIWIRAVLANVPYSETGDAVFPPSLQLPAGFPTPSVKNPWVIYLPGYSRSDFNDAASMPSAIEPLAELSLRSNWWDHENGRQWTPQGFLTAKSGANLRIPKDEATKAALADTLEYLLGESIETLQMRGTLDAAKLNAFTIKDPDKQILAWISDPEALKSSMTDAEWRAFVSTANSKYDLDITKATPINAAQLLGNRSGVWDTVWQRFTEAPELYPGILKVLDQARPPALLVDHQEPHPDSWPSWNREQEIDLAAELKKVPELADPSVARKRISELETQHGGRRGNVWATLGQAPLAAALAKLSKVTEITASTPTATSLAEFGDWYATEGHKADRAALALIATPPTVAEHETLLAALAAIYDPWVDDVATKFQAAARSSYFGEMGVSADLGTCVYFVDALRYDLATQLCELLPSFSVDLRWRLAPFPTVTHTGQPAVAPIPLAQQRTWTGGKDFDAATADGKSLLGDHLKKQLQAASVQVIAPNEHQLGDPSGIAWTVNSEIDSLGHSQGSRLPSQIPGALDRVASRITELLSSGWRRVIVVTDHGFLLPVNPARKVELPLSVTENEGCRKPRVARLKAGATRPSFPIVPWTWDADIEMVSAPGATSFELGATYDHGGLSPQECIIPILEVTADTSVVESTMATKIERIKWTGQRCRIDFTPPDLPVVVEIRSAPGDPDTVLSDSKAPSEPGEAKILVADPDLAGDTAFVVLLGETGKVLAQKETVIGGDRG